MSPPGYMRPSENFGSLDAFGLLKLHEVSRKFSNEFHIEEHAAFATVLTAASHCLGGAAELAVSSGRVSAPFSTMVLTPERLPIWIEIPNRFLASDLGYRLEFLIENYEAARRELEQSAPSESSQGVVSVLHAEAKAAQSIIADGISDHVWTDTLGLPFPRSVLDNRISISTPPIGLFSALRALGEAERMRLWNCLSAERPVFSPGDGKRSGIPSFLWQVFHGESQDLFKEFPWLLQLPALLIRSQHQECPPIHGLSKSAASISKLNEDLFFHRYGMKGKTKTFVPSESAMVPISEFLEVVRLWRQENESDEAEIFFSSRWTMTLGLKLALLLCVVEGEAQVERRFVQYGIELAKHLVVESGRNLSAAHRLGIQCAADTTDMNERERAVYLKICQKQGITPADLSRSFHSLRKKERDQIVSSLLSRRLIRIEGELLLQNAA